MMSEPQEYKIHSVIVGGRLVHKTSASYFQGLVNLKIISLVCILEQNF